MNFSNFSDAILKFSIDRTPYDDTFRSNILERLSKIITCKQLAFTIINHKDNYSNSINLTNNLSMEKLFNNSYYRQSIFNPNVLENNFEMKKIDINSSILTNDMLISSSHYENSVYYKEFLSRGKVYYFAVVYFIISEDHVASIAFFRDKNMGKFSDDEIFLIESLKPIISNRILDYYEVSYLCQAKNILNHGMESLNIGVVYLDKHFKLISNNSIARDYLMKIFGKMPSISNYSMQDFLNKISFKSELKNMKFSKPYLFYLNNVQIEYFKFSVPHVFDKSDVKYVMYFKKLSKNTCLEFRSRHSFNLTRREYEVAKLLSLGLGNEEISIELNISVNTVRTHVERILSKTETKSRSAAIVKLCTMELE